MNKKIIATTKFQTLQFPYLEGVGCREDLSLDHPSCSLTFQQCLADPDTPIHGPPLSGLTTSLWHSGELGHHLYGPHSTAAEGVHCCVCSPGPPMKAYRFGSTSEIFKQMF